MKVGETPGNGEESPTFREEPDVIGELSVAIVNHLTEERMPRVIRSHPTFEGAIAEVLNTLCENI